MKTKPLTFLLSLTFLFLFCGSVYGDDLQDGMDAYGRGDYREPNLQAVEDKETKIISNRAIATGFSQEEVDQYRATASEQDNTSPATESVDEAVRAWLINQGYSKEEAYKLLPQVQTPEQLNTPPAKDTKVERFTNDMLEKGATQEEIDQYITENPQSFQQTPKQNTPTAIGQEQAEQAFNEEVLNEPAAEARDEKTIVDRAIEAGVPQEQVDSYLAKTEQPNDAQPAEDPFIVAAIKNGYSREEAVQYLADNPRTATNTPPAEDQWAEQAFDNEVLNEPADSSISLTKYATPPAEGTKTEIFTTKALDKGVPQESIDQYIAENPQHFQQEAEGTKTEIFTTEMLEKGVSQESIDQYIAENPQHFQQETTEQIPIQEMTPEEMTSKVAAYQNMYPNSADMFRSAVDMMASKDVFKSDMLKHQYELEEILVTGMQKQGVDISFDTYGRAIHIDKEGQEHYIEPGFFDAMALKQFEIAGGIAGGFTGARAGAAIGSAIGSVVPGAGTAAGAAIGATAGFIVFTAAGVFLGSGLDYLRDAYVLREELDAKVAWTKMIEDGVAVILMVAIGGAVWKTVLAPVAGKVVRVGKNAFNLVRDGKEAFRWYRLSAEQGNATAQFNLGVRYLTGEGVLQDDKEAVKWYRLSAEQGEAMGQYNLGVMYAKGEEVPQDYKEAVKWYRLSAEQGDADGQFGLGVMYRNGYGVPQDYKEAVRWYRLSAQQGNESAQNNLGMTYRQGQGVPRDYTLAHMWFNLCGSNGGKGCVKNRNIVEKKMSPSQIEEAQEMARIWKPTRK